MKLIDKSALIAEIESKKNRAQILGDNAVNGSMQQFYDGMKQGCVDILSFIDSLQEEPVSEDLEQAIDNYLATYWGGEKEKQDWPFLKKMAIHFANWQREQMMKDAFVFESKHNTACCLASECLRNHGWFGRERDFNDLWQFICGVKELFSGEFKTGDKVKLIIIKQEEK